MLTPTPGEEIPRVRFYPSARHIRSLRHQFARAPGIPFADVLPTDLVRQAFDEWQTPGVEERKTAATVR